ncbi:MAG: hypothetical protein Q9167_002805 [Letrouitia subvulpina]
MSVEERPPDPNSINHSRSKVITFHSSDTTRRRSQASRFSSNHDEERARIEYERLRMENERLRRDWDRMERDQAKRDDFEYFERERERLERDQAKRDEEQVVREMPERLSLRTERERRERDQVSSRRAELSRIEEFQRKEREFLRREELSRRERELMEREEQRVKVVRKERRTNSGRIIPESRQTRVERTLSPGLSAPVLDEPKSFFSRWSSLLSSSPAAKIDAEAKVEVAPKNEKPEPQPRSTQGSVVDLEGYFLQPAEDSRLQKSVVALGDSIDQHVYNHYSNQVTRLPSDVFLKILQFEEESLRLPKNLSNQEAFRLAAVRRLIAIAITKDISVDGDPDTTFLPKEIVSLLTMVPGHSTEKFRFTASSVFRRTAANLLRLSQNGESQAYAKFRSEQVRNASDRLHKQLSVLASLDSNEAARREQLEAIMTKAAQFGVLLLLQPATYRFEWSVRLSGGSSFDNQGRGKPKAEQFMTFPALIKTGDSTGRELRKAQLVCKPEYMDEDDLNGE